MKIVETLSAIDFNALWAQALDLIMATDLQIQVGALLGIVCVCFFAAQRINRRFHFQGLMKYNLARRLQPALAPLIMPMLVMALTAFGAAILAQFDMSHVLMVVASKLLLAWVIIRLAAGYLKDSALAKPISAIVWGLTALSLLGWLEPSLALLDSMAIHIGSMHVSILTLLEAALTLSLLVWGALLISRWAEHYLSTTTSITPSAQVLVGKIVRIILIVFAVVTGLGTAGIDFTVLALFSGAIGVGIGFGLQKVVSNFISGLIILLDRSIKPGDTIELDETFGWITKLSARYVSVATRDGYEHLIPNEDFITQRVINMSYTNNNVRLKIPVGVAYGSDVRKAIALVVEAANENDRVLSDPAPVCWLKEFGDSSINLELRCWIGDPQRGMMNVRGDVNLRIYDKFEEHNIPIPFPQMDVHVKDLPQISPTPKKKTAL